MFFDLIPVFGENWYVSKNPRTTTQQRNIWNDINAFTGLSVSAYSNAVKIGKQLWRATIYTILWCNHDSDICDLECRMCDAILITFTNMMCEFFVNV